MIALALACQLALLAYHQLTTLVDLHPFNGSRHSTRAEKLAEAAVNGVLMSLAPIGFAFGIRGLMLYGVVYYFALFAIEVVIWWIPYFFVPRAPWRRLYNRVLALGTSNFEPGDTLERWIAIHRRIHSDTVTFLPRRPDRITPNLEHTLLHAATLATAVATLVAFAPRG